MKKTIIELTSVYKNYNKSGRGLPAIDHLSLSLYEGEILGLIGESGCGKTTIGKSILKLSSIDSGSIKIFDKEVTSLSERKFRPTRTNIQMIFQDLDAALNPNMRIENILNEILKRHHKTSKLETQERLLKLLSDVQMEPDILERYPTELSGGQKRRIAIASALAVEPKIIIADEPTTGLDNYTQSLIMQLIIDLQTSKNLSMILISHDLQLVKKMCQRVVVMYLGNIIEIGDAEKISKQPAHPYSALLWHSHLKHTANTNTIRKHDIRSGLHDYERPSDGCRFSPRCKRYIEMGRPEKCTSIETKPELQELDDNHVVACHFPL